MSRSRTVASLACTTWLLAGCATAPEPAKAPAKAEGTPYVHVVADPDGGRALLAPVAARAQASGAGAFALLGATVGTEGDRVGAFVDIPKDGCALAVAEGSATVQDIDLFAFADDGAMLASDEASSSSAALLVSPPHPGRLYVAARIMSGAGFFALGAAPISAADAPKAALAVGARGQGDESGKLDSWPGLEAKMRERRAALGARWEDMRRLVAPLDPRASTRITVPIEADRCGDVFIVPSDEVASVDVLVETRDGRIVARAHPYGRDRGIVLCSDTDETLTLALRPRSAQGAAAVVVGRAPKGAASEIARRVRVDRLSTSLELDASRSAYAKELGAAWGTPSLVARGRAVVGSRVSHPLSLDKGCTRIDVVAGKPLGAVTAAVWDEATGELLAETTGSLVATLRVCGAARPARVDVEAYERPGPYAVEMRHDAAAPAPLVAHGLAASRLLERALTPNDAASAQVADGAQVASLDEGKLARVPLKLEPNACYDVVAALDKGGSGLDLRIVAMGAPSAPIVRGRYVASERVCTDDTPARTLELRLGRGRADALILARKLDR